MLNYPWKWFCCGYYLGCLAQFLLRQKTEVALHGFLLAYCLARLDCWLRLCQKLNNQKATRAFHR